jgi:hypothetical protein
MRIIYHGFGVLFCLHVEISEAVRATKIILFIERDALLCVFMMHAYKAWTPLYSIVSSFAWVGN